jgi:prepilin-type N-terminal cleavage/methylation domain-containing protein
VLNLFKEKNKGFTIIEMLFVVGIFGILTAIVVYNYSKFDNEIILTNTTYEVALQVRQAQVYSIGVRSSGEGGSGRSDFETQFGTFIYLDGSNQNMILFADVSGVAHDAGVCDDTSGDACGVIACPTGAGEECREIASLTRGVTFSAICKASAGTNLVDVATGDCDSGATSEDSVNISFQRPNPDAIIDGNTGKDVAIVLTAPGVGKRMVLVRSSGQISVQRVE